MVHYKVAVMAEKMVLYLVFSKGGKLVVKKAAKKAELKAVSMAA